MVCSTLPCVRLPSETQSSHRGFSWSSASGEARTRRYFFTAQFETVSTNDCPIKARHPTAPRTCPATPGLPIVLEPSGTSAPTAMFATTFNSLASSTDNQTTQGMRGVPWERRDMKIRSSSHQAALCRHSTGRANRSTTSLATTTSGSGVNVLQASNTP